MKKEQCGKVKYGSEDYAREGAHNCITMWALLQSPVPHCFTNELGYPILSHVIDGASFFSFMGLTYKGSNYGLLLDPASPSAGAWREPVTFPLFWVVESTKEFVFCKKVRAFPELRDTQVQWYPQAGFEERVPSLGVSRKLTLQWSYIDSLFDVHCLWGFFTFQTWFIIVRKRGSLRSKVDSFTLPYLLRKAT